MSRWKRRGTRFPMSSGRNPKPSRLPDSSLFLKSTMSGDTQVIKKRAPTLYAIIAIKLLKGLLFVSLAIVAYTLSDNNLPEDYQKLLHHLRLNPERRFWAELAKQVGQLTEPNLLWAAAGTLVYSLFS